MIKRFSNSRRVSVRGIGKSMIMERCLIPNYLAGMVPYSFVPEEKQHPINLFEPMI